MTEKPFKGIKFPGLPDNYMVPETDKSLSKEGAAADAEAVGERINEIESYGIGKAIGEFCSDCNKAIYNGWYYISGETINKPEGQDLSYFDGAMFVVARWAKIFQTIYITISGEVTELIRNTLDNGANWSEWEWKNPPMTAGVEYRTTERRNGMPVYVKKETSIGALAGGSVSDGSYRTLLKATTIPYPASVHESKIRIQTDVGRQNATGICVLLQPDNSVRFIHAQLDATEAIKDTSAHPYYDLVVTYPNGYNQQTYIDWTVKYTK